MNLEELVGKTVSGVERCSYSTNVVLHFTDGSVVRLVPGSTGCHNDRWPTVEYIIQSAEEVRLAKEQVLAAAQERKKRKRGRSRTKKQPS